MPAAVTISRKTKKKNAMSLLEQEERTKVAKLPIYQQPGQRSRLMICNACGKLKKIPGHRKNTCDGCFSNNGVSENIMGCYRSNLESFNRDNCSDEWDNTTVYC